jgi:hypothetical protein
MLRVLKPSLDGLALNDGLRAMRHTALAHDSDEEPDEGDASRRLGVLLDARYGLPLGRRSLGVGAHAHPRQLPRRGRCVGAWGRGIEPIPRRVCGVEGAGSRRRW